MYQYFQSSDWENEEVFISPNKSHLNWVMLCRRFVHTSDIQLLPPYPHPTHEMGWGKDGDVMYMNAWYCYILVHVFYNCLFITVLHSSSWWVCKLGPHCFSSYTWSTSTLFLIIHMIKVPVLINSNSPISNVLNDFTES